MKVFTKLAALLFAGAASRGAVRFSLTKSGRSGLEFARSAQVNRKSQKKRRLIARRAA